MSGREQLGPYTLTWPAWVFPLGADTLALGGFVPVRRGWRVCDLGTGSGIITILMASRHPDCRFAALEIQPEMADMAARSMALNGLTDRVEVRSCDFREAARLYGYGKFSLAVCNPPYGKAGGALLSQTETQRIARHESDCTVDDLAAAAFDLLKTGGRLAVVFPAARAFELMYAMRTHRLEPKRIRTIHATPNRAPKLVLIEAVKDGGSMLHWMEPLVLNGDDGQPTEEWKRIYRVPEKT